MLLSSGWQKVTFIKDQSQTKVTFSVVQVTHEADDYQQELSNQRDSGCGPNEQAIRNLVRVI
jgi:hypothetical protein